MPMSPLGPHSSPTSVGVIHHITWQFLLEITTARQCISVVMECFYLLWSLLQKNALRHLLQRSLKTFQCSQSEIWCNTKFPLEPKGLLIPWWHTCLPHSVFKCSSLQTTKSLLLLHVFLLCLFTWSILPLLSPPNLSSTTIGLSAQMNKFLCLLKLSLVTTFFEENIFDPKLSINCKKQ